MFNSEVLKGKYLYNWNDEKHYLHARNFKILMHVKKWKKTEDFFNIQKFELIVMKYQIIFIVYFDEGLYFFIFIDYSNYFENRYSE